MPPSGFETKPFIFTSSQWNERRQGRLWYHTARNKITVHVGISSCFLGARALEGRGWGTRWWHGVYLGAFDMAIWLPLGFPRSNRQRKKQTKTKQSPETNNSTTKALIWTKTKIGLLWGWLEVTKRMINFWEEERNHQSREKLRVGFNSRHRATPQPWPCPTQCLVLGCPCSARPPAWGPSAHARALWPFRTAPDPSENGCGAGVGGTDESETAARGVTVCGAAREWLAVRGVLCLRCADGVLCAEVIVCV